jgi:hypothetical protein
MGRVRRRVRVSRVRKWGGVVAVVKPTHGGRRPNAGRPISTGSKGTPLIQFRLSAAQYQWLLDKATGGNVLHVNPSLVAKDIVVRVSGEAATKKP